MDAVVELELEDRYNDAWKTYYASLTTGTVDNKKAAAEQRKIWKQYIESIDIRKIKHKAEEKKKDPLKALRGIVPFVG